MKIKHFFKITILFLVVMLLFACKASQKSENPDAYCDSLQIIHDNVILQVDSFFQSTRYSDFNTNEYFDKALMTITEQLEKLKKIGNFEKDTTLYISLNHLLSEIYQILRNEGEKIVQLDASLLREYDKIKINILDSIESVAINKIQLAQLQFDSVTIDFLHRYGYDVERDSTQYELKNE